MKEVGTPFNNRVGKFFRGLKSKNFLVFLFFFLVSCFFWIVLAIKDPVEKEFLIPVRIIHIPDNVIIRDGFDSLNVTVSVKDNGYNLIGYDLNHVKPIEVNFRHYAKGDDGKLTISNYDLKKEVRGKLASSSQVISIKPEKLEIFFDYGDSKMIPVSLKNVDIIPDYRYVIDEAKVTPNYVKAYATAARLKQLDSVWTNFLEIDNVTGKETKKVKLKNINGVKFEPDVVAVNVIADALIEDTVDVPIIMVNVPDSIQLHLTSEKVKVSFVTGARKKGQFNAMDFKVVTDYKSMNMDSLQKLLPVTLEKYPSSEVMRPKLEFDQVDYLILR